MLCVWHNRLILSAFINLAMSAPLIRRSRSALLRILQLLSPVRSGPCKATVARHFLEENETYRNA